MLIRSILRWKTALALKRSCNFSRAKIERINTVARHVLLHDITLYQLTLTCCSNCCQAYHMPIFIHHGFIILIKPRVNNVITLLAGDLAPGGARSSAGTVMTMVVLGHQQTQLWRQHFALNPLTHSIVGKPAKCLYWSYPVLSAPLSSR